MILKVSNFLVLLESLSRLFQRFMTDGRNEDWYNDKRHHEQEEVINHTDVTNCPVRKNEK